MSGRPGDVIIDPSIANFYGPFTTKPSSVTFRVTNTSTQRIAFAVKSSNLGRLETEPSSGILDPQERAEIIAVCQPFDYANNKTTSDKFTVVWRNAPSFHKSKEADFAWFEDAAGNKERVFPVVYNP